MDEKLSNFQENNIKTKSSLSIGTDLDKPTEHVETISSFENNTTNFELLGVESKEYETTRSQNSSGFDGMVIRLPEETEGSPFEETCPWVAKRCFKICKPCIAHENPLPPSPTFCQTLKYTLMCPIHGFLATLVTYIFILIVIWSVLWSLTGNNAMPGGNLFSIFILCICCLIGGFLIKFLKLPPLLGMLIVGCLLRNIPKLKYIGESINDDWSSSLRSLALVVILTRAGLGLDPIALKKLSCGVLRLAFIPCLVEALIVAISSHFLLKLPWLWGLMLGFVLAAVSPAVVVPSLLLLTEKGFGIEKGIPTLVIAAASIDDVLAISCFGLMMALTFSTGSIGLIIAKGPLEVIGGIFYGIILGVLLWFIPNNKNSGNMVFKFVLLFGFGIFAVIGSRRLQLEGAGALGSLTVSFVAGLGWRNDKKSDKIISNYFFYLWIIFEPLLFGLIGTQIKIKMINGSTIGFGILVLFIGLCFRFVASFFSVFRLNLNLKEKLFVSLAWMPKATVQAAIGSLALDAAIKKGGEDEKKFGLMILTIAVLVILITAPLGAACIAISGPRLLKKYSINEETTVNSN